jgi:hypothetical protein
MCAVLSECHVIYTLADRNSIFDAIIKLPSKWDARVMEDQILFCMYYVFQGTFSFVEHEAVMLKGRLIAEVQ